jgi:hypothetical protein
MKRLFVFILPLLVLPLLASCGGGQGTTKIKKGPMPPNARWTGTYFTNWGDMELVQSGTSVVGTFGDRDGKIEGTVDGNVFTFHWSEEAKSAITSNKKRVEGSGIIKFYVVEAGEDKIDEHRVEGTWGYGSETSGGGKWSGYKSSKDVKEEQRLKLVGSGAASKSTSQVAGDADDDYVPPPSPQYKGSDDLDDIPPPVVE